MHVNPGGLRAGMPQNSLDRTLSNATSDKLGSEAMSETVRSDVAFNPDLITELGHNMLHCAWANCIAGNAVTITSTKCRECTRSAGFVTPRLPVRGQDTG